MKTTRHYIGTAVTNRPNTIKESFDYLLANLGVSQIVRETVQPDLENISNIIRCNTLNLDKVKKRYCWLRL